MAESQSQSQEPEVVDEDPPVEPAVVSVEQRASGIGEPTAASGPASVPALATERPSTSNASASASPRLGTSQGPREGSRLRQQSSTAPAASGSAPLTSDRGAKSVNDLLERMRNGAQTGVLLERPWTAYSGTAEEEQRPASPPKSPGRTSKPIPAGEFNPCHQYAQPPAVVQRINNGVVEGTLMYQLGKLAPLGPTFSPYWLRDPPQRPAVTDLRLAPSQRNVSCYSPEFLDYITAPLTTSPAATSAATTAVVGGYAYPRPRSPHAQSRPETASADTFSHRQLRPSFRSKSPREGRWASSTRPASGVSRPSSPAAPLLQYIRATAQPTSQTGGVFIPRGSTTPPLSTLVKQASRAVNGAILSRKLHVSRLSDGHTTPPTELQERANMAMSNDKGAKMPFKERMRLYQKM